MSRRLAVLGMALLVAAGWFVVTAPSGRAASDLQTAWWSSAESSNGAVPAPPTLPDGGLWVSSNPSGTVSLSAVRVTLSPGEGAPTLVLDVHQAVPPTAVQLTAYPTSSSWTPGPAQAWSSKPAFDAEGVRADGALSSDGKHVTFDLSGLVTGQDLSVVVAPSPIAAAPPAPLPAPPAPSPPTFDITFEKPSAGALHVSAAPVAAADTSAPPDAAATPAPAPVSDFSTPAASFTPALPSGLSTPPPAVSTGVSSGRVASPSVAFSNRPRLLVPAASKRSFADSAAIAIMLGIVILWLARDTSTGGSVRRPRLSLYDAPKPAEAMAVARTGTAPPLR